MLKKILIGTVIFISFFSLDAIAQMTDNMDDNESVSTPKAPLIEEARMDSINILKMQLEKAPNDELLLSRLGNLQVKLKLMEDAFFTYNHLIGVNPKNYDACLFLGHNYYVKGKKLLQYEDKKYKEVEKPKKMQYADYQNRVREILGKEYKLALQYLSIAISGTPSKFIQCIIEEMQYRILHPDPFQ